MEENVPEDLLIKKLAEAIQKTLKNSKLVRKAIEAIEKEGHECMLSFSAAVVVNDEESDSSCEDCQSTCMEEMWDIDFSDDVEPANILDFDEHDIAFLKSIKIKLS